MSANIAIFAKYNGFVKKRIVDVNDVPAVSYAVAYVRVLSRNTASDFIDLHMYATAVKPEANAL